MLFYRDVHVYRLISKDTVEAAMLAQADRKLELEKQIQRKCQHCQPHTCLSFKPQQTTLCALLVFLREFSTINLRNRMKIYPEFNLATWLDWLVSLN